MASTLKRSRDNDLPASASASASAKRHSPSPIAFIDLTADSESDSDSDCEFVSPTSPSPTASSSSASSSTSGSPLASASPYSLPIINTPTLVNARILASVDRPSVRNRPNPCYRGSTPKDCYDNSLSRLEPYFVNEDSDTQYDHWRAMKSVVAKELPFGFQAARATRDASWIRYTVDIVNFLVKSTLGMDDSLQDLCHPWEDILEALASAVGHYVQAAPVAKKGQYATTQQLQETPSAGMKYVGWIGIEGEGGDFKRHIYVTEINHSRLDATITALGNMQFYNFNFSSAPSAPSTPAPSAPTLPSTASSSSSSSGNANANASASGSNESQSLCVACWDAPRHYAFVSCGHKLMCGGCVKKVTQCPTCRKSVKKYIRIFE